MLKKVSLLSLSVISAFAMHSFEINISDKDLGVYTRLDMGQFVKSIKPESTMVGFSFFQGNEDHSDGKMGLIRPLYQLSFLKKRELGRSDISLGLGIKANYTTHFSSLPLGAEVRYKLPLEDFVPINLNVLAYYAPEVLSMIDSREYLEFGLNIDIEVIRDGFITVGYRRIETNYEFRSFEIDSLYNESGYLGYKFTF